jgi:hypothetical protein
MHLTALRVVSQSHNLGASFGIPFSNRNLLPLHRGWLICLADSNRSRAKRIDPEQFVMSFVRGESAFKSRTSGSSSLLGSDRLFSRDFDQLLNSCAESDII